MKYILFLVMSFFLVSLFLTAPVFALTDYLDYVGDFEGNSEDWDINVSQNAVCEEPSCLEITTSTYDLYHGEQALVFTATNTEENNFFQIEKIITVNADTDYNLMQELYVKSLWNDTSSYYDLQIVQALTSSSCPQNFGENSVAWNFNTSSPGWANCTNGCYSAPTYHFDNLSNLYNQYNHYFFLPEETGEQYLCMRVIGTINYDAGVLWLDWWRILGTGSTPTTTPTTTPTITSTEDTKITNILLMLVVTILAIDILRRLLMPFKKE